MDDVLLVRGLDAIDQLLDDGQRIVERHWALQILALDVLHDEEVRPDVIEMTDVGVVQRGDRPDLAREPIRELFRRDLDGDVAVEARVVGAIHLAHAALPDERGDLVGTDNLSHQV